jgi:hypothetical protein
MTEHRVSRWGALAVAMWLVAPAAGAQAPATQVPATQAPTTQAPTTQAPTTQAPFEPKVGQAGKDVVCVPTRQALVD